MGKHKEKSTRGDKHDRLLRRLKKLERKLKRRTDRVASTRSSVSDNEGAISDREIITDENMSRPLNLSSSGPRVQEKENTAPTSSRTRALPVVTSVTVVGRPNEASTSNTTPLDQPQPIEVAEVSVPLDEEILLIIGESPQSKEGEVTFSPHISLRWAVWLKEGQKKEVKEALVKKHVRKGACFLEAPTLNPEVAASLNDSSLKRDKYFCKTQNLAGSALSALGKVIDPLLTQRREDIDVKKTIEGLWETSQLLAEVYRGQTVARRSCIIPSINKQVALVLEKTATDEFLFGAKLGEKLKEARSVDKVGQGMKFQQPLKKHTPSYNQGNSKHPSALRPMVQTGSRMGFVPKPSQRVPHNRFTSTKQAQKPYRPTPNRQKSSKQEAR